MFAPCVVDLNPYQLSCPGTYVAQLVECSLREQSGFESHLGQLFWDKGVVLGVVDFLLKRHGVGQCIC